MKLLFDQNLSRKLVTRLADIFPNASHVQLHGLAEKTDTEIWDFAKLNDFCIVTSMIATKQKDFVHPLQWFFTVTIATPQMKLKASAAVELELYVRLRLKR